MKILVINGPNLNFIGIREPDIYGTKSYEDLVSYLSGYGKTKNIDIEIFQSNHEGDIIDKLQEAYYNKVDGIVINPGALAHYSYALRDAISSISIDTVEVHLSDIASREDFRHKSIISTVCIKNITGKHFKGYIEGIEELIKRCG